MENLDFLSALLQLGWPAIVMIQCVILWRDNQALRSELVRVLEQCSEIPPPVKSPTIRGEKP